MAALTIERGGLIRAGPDAIARLDLASGRIFAGGRAEGLLERGIIYEFVGGGRAPVAALRGFVPSRGVRITASNGTTLVHIQRNLVVEVLEIRNGFYLVRLPGGLETWMGAELVALAMVAVEADGSECNGASGVLVRSSGRTIPYETCERDGEVYRLETPEGLILVDSLDVKEIVPGRLNAATSDAVRFSGGHSLFGNVERAGDVVRVTDERGGITIADVQRVEGAKI